MSNEEEVSSSYSPAVLCANCACNLKNKRPYTYRRKSSKIKQSLRITVGSKLTSGHESSNINYIPRGPIGRRDKNFSKMSGWFLHLNKKRAYKEAFKKIIVKQIENAHRLLQSLDRYNPYMMEECLAKLSNIKNITQEAVLAVHDAIIGNDDLKVTLLTSDDPLLRTWIENVLRAHPKYNACPAWM